MVSTTLRVIAKYREIYYRRHCMNMVKDSQPADALQSHTSTGHGGQPSMDANLHFNGHSQTSVLVICGHRLGMDGQLAYRGSYFIYFVYDNIHHLFVWLYGIAAAQPKSPVSKGVARGNIQLQAGVGGRLRCT